MEMGEGNEERKRHGRIFILSSVVRWPLRAGFGIDTDDGRR